VSERRVEKRVVGEREWGVDILLWKGRFFLDDGREGICTRGL
jgi:hypothetical protein